MGYVKKQCTSCWGSGEGGSCYICNGSGRTSSSDGTYITGCTSCGGSGKRKCTRCNGSGQEEEYVSDSSSSSSYSSPSSSSYSGGSRGGGNYQVMASYFNAADRLYQQKDYQGAIDAYNNALQYCQDSQKGSVYMNAANIYIDMGDYNYALEIINKAISYGESYRETRDRMGKRYYTRGRIYAKMGKDDLAISDYKKSVDLGENTAIQYLKRDYNIDYTPPPPPVYSSSSDNYSSTSSSNEKSHGVLVVLSILLGLIGADRFYAGRFGLGIVKLLTTGGWGIWWIIDIILAITGKQKDANGNNIASTSALGKIVSIIIFAGFVFAAIAGGNYLYKNILAPVLSKTSTQQSASATVTTNVNFRSGPSTNDAVIRQLQQGDKVTLTGEVSGTWTQISHNGDTGWVSSEFLNK